jgi:glycerophosphoryl diester phosphodiesterase
MYQEAPLPRICERALALGCSWVGMDYHLFSPDAPDIAHQYGLRLGAWTVNSVKDLRTLSQTRIDTVTSDRPDLFAQL